MTSLPIPPVDRLLAPFREFARINASSGIVLMAAAIVAALGSAPRPLALDKARIERQIRDLALDHAAGRLEDEVYLERLRGLRETKESVERTTTERISAERAVAWLEALSATWREADVPEAKAEVLHAIYDGSWSQGGRSCRSG